MSIELLGYITNATLAQCAEVQQCIADRLQEFEVPREAEGVDIGYHLYNAWERADDTASFIRVADKKIRGVA